MNITPAQIPSSCNTVEKLLSWCVYALASQVGGIAVLEERDRLPERITQYQTFQTPSGEPMVYYRVTLPLKPDHVTDTSGKLWTKVLPITEAPIPATYASN